VVLLGDWLSEDCAHLIAAAPDMLEALKAMLDTHGNPHPGEWINEAGFKHAKVIDAQARAAIAKAEGKP
jgi:hypothetical protein